MQKPYVRTVLLTKGVPTISDLRRVLEKSPRRWRVRPDGEGKALVFADRRDGASDETLNQELDAILGDADFAAEDDFESERAGETANAGPAPTPEELKS